jgi:DnaJ-class molecular chaperone
MEQAFRGYMALPGIGEAGGIKWWEVLGVPINSDPELVRKAYTTLVKKHHPDVNGERELFDRVQAAWELFSTMAPK